MRPARSVTVPIRARARMVARRAARRRVGPAASGTTAQKPQPMLKTSHISASATSPSSRTARTRAARAAGPSISKPTSACRRSRFEQPAAGDVREPVHGDVRAQQLEHRAHVDHGRLEQRVGDGCAAERGRASRRARAPSPARGGRASSRWSAGRTDGSPISASPGAHARAGDDRVERDRAEARRA